MNVTDDIYDGVTTKVHVLEKTIYFINPIFGELL
jgi:hypothetical protein